MLIASQSREWPMIFITGEASAYGFGRRKDEIFLQLKALLEPCGLTRFYTDRWRTHTRHLDTEVHRPGTRLIQKVERKHLTLWTRIKLGSPCHRGHVSNPRQVTPYVRFSRLGLSDHLRPGAVKVACRIFRTRRSIRVHWCCTGPAVVREKCPASRVPAAMAPHVVGAIGPGHGTSWSSCPGSKSCATRECSGCFATSAARVPRKPRRSVGSRM
jgi:insertion element IS1 protein InsB